LEAECIVSHALGVSRLEIYLNHDKPCTLKERELIKGFLKRRYNREPLAYITGICNFWSLKLKIEPGVLIPRKDTEVLVEHTLSLIPDLPRSSYFSILELGTGSAAIPLALSLERKGLSIYTVEKSQVSLRVAKENILQYQLQLVERDNRIFQIQGDRFLPIKSGINFNLIVSNPPYIPSLNISNLQEEVSLWEPSLALDGGKDGLDFYRYLKEAGEMLLSPKGYLVFEHGYDQLEEIKKIMDKSKVLTHYQEIKDIEGRDRVLIYQKSM